MKNCNVQKSSSRLPLISVFKGVAMLMVILVHSAQAFVLPEWATYLPRLGQTGCQIFFVVSAFTLCLSFERRLPSVWEFMLNRIKRIGLSWWCAILLFILVRLSFSLIGIADESGIGVFDVLANILFLNGLVPGVANNGVVRGGWYIGTAMVLYLLTPMLYRLFSWQNQSWQKHRAWLFPLGFLALSAAIQIPTMGIQQELFGASSFMYHSFLNQLPCYALGFTLYAMHKSERKPNAAVSLSGFVVSLCGGCVFFFGDTGVDSVFAPFMFGLAFVFLYTALSEWSEKQDFFCAFMRFLSRLGDKSLFVYLTHSLITVEGVLVLRKLLSIVEIAVDDFYLYMLAFPFIFILSIIIGELFGMCIGKLDSAIFSQKHDGK